MWRWLMNVFAPRYQPLERPEPLSAPCSDTIDSPSLKPARAIQHTADSVIAGARGKRDILLRHRQRLLERQANPRGIGDERGGK